tara:strand:+ start:2848 stop:4005 length:1158 start_codon:yes stop_codon:yes gene_type:complete
LAVLYFNEAATGSADGSSEANGYTDLQTAMDAVAAGDTLYLKNGSSRYGAATTTITFTVDAGSAANNTHFEGYGSTPGDGVHFQTATRFNITGDHSNWFYLDIDVSSGGAGISYAMNTNTANNVYYRCKMKSAGVSVGTTQAYSVFKPVNSIVYECSFVGKIGNASSYVYYGNRCDTFNCYIESRSDGEASVGGSLVNAVGGHRAINIQNCVIVEKRSTPGSSIGIMCAGADNGQHYSIGRNTIVGTGSDGIQIDGPDTNSPYGCTINQNIIYDCGGYGVRNTQDHGTYTHSMACFNNAFGAVTSGQTLNMEINEGAVTLSGDPFVDHTDFVLNTTAGAGALCRGVSGVPNPVDPTSSTRTSFPSIGAIQPELGGSGGGTVGFAI